MNTLNERLIETVKSTNKLAFMNYFVIAGICFELYALVNYLDAKYVSSFLMFCYGTSFLYTVIIIKRTTVNTNKFFYISFFIFTLFYSFMAPITLWNSDGLGFFKKFFYICVSVINIILNSRYFEDQIISTALSLTYSLNLIWLVFLSYTI